MYGSKPLSTDGSVNSHGLYVTGIDDANKNVQSILNLSQGNSQLYLSTGHANAGQGQQDYSVVAGNKTLQLSGGLLPGITDKQITLFANSQAQTIPIQVDGKAGYKPSANVTITEATQFASKAYVDAQVSAGGGGQPDKITSQDANKST